MAAADLRGRALAALCAGIGDGFHRLAVRVVPRLVDVVVLSRVPMLASDNAAAGRTIDGLHQAMEWTLLVVIGLHVAAAMAHLFVFRDRVMQRMLPALQQQ